MTKKFLLFAVMLGLVFVLPASAAKLTTDSFVLEGTSAEFNEINLSDLLFGNVSVGAIVMQEGQRGVSTQLLPDNNYEDDLGSYELSFRNVYASGSAYVGQIHATSSDSTVAGSKICTADGTNCALATTNALWTTSGTYALYYSSSTAFTAGIGSTTPGAFWTVDGMADVIQLQVQGHSTQNTNLAEFQASDATPVFWVSNSGNVAASGTLQVTGVSTFTGAITATGGLTSGADLVSDTNNTDSLGGNIAWKNVYASGTIFTAGLTNYGNSAITGTLQVTGATTLTGALVANGNVDLGSDIDDTVSILGYVDANLHASSSLLVTGATTSTDIMPFTAATYNLGNFVDNWKNVYSSGTIYGAAANFDGNVDLGDAITDTITLSGYIDSAVFASSTLGVTDVVDFYATTSLRGTGADLIVEGNGTSTFAGTMLINKGSAATSTLQVGSGVGTSGFGGCIVLESMGGSGNLYIMYDSAVGGMTTSTDAAACY